ncbi:uncharacterized protein BYT42DRAFT_563629 [Radiomyces spectabilis]|uniref:uncharacterized protein n=1 Tax=Radiomyces spectabilis TaxID=64574 RepID=UPI0022201D37|nr:uncharacterized protein BYT42DRAFT_563629 [Radiomyces spectabilis]KAI8384776.1 hypothetical protein BYT42DRAFT_563629 [Radiomyces spectabilis]
MTDTAARSDTSFPNRLPDEASSFVHSEPTVEALSTGQDSVTQADSLTSPATTTTATDAINTVAVKRTATEDPEEAKDPKVLKTELSLKAEEVQVSKHHESEEEKSAVDTEITEVKSISVEQDNAAAAAAATFGTPQPTDNSSLDTANGNSNNNDKATINNADDNSNNNNNNNQSNTNNNNTLLSVPTNANGQSAALSLLTDPQHQQLLQYAQAHGHDLANLTASSLAQAMVSPIAVPGMTSNLLQQLQGSNVITALPGPPQMPHQPTTMPHQDGNSPLSEDGQGKRGPNSRQLTNDERRQRRLLRNRVAAKECRKKKKQYIQDMEDKIARLEEDNNRLRKEVDDLNAKLAIGAMQGSESYRLMKEVEELNAKLGMGHLPTNSALTAAVMAAATAHHQQQHQVSSHHPPAPAPLQPSASPQTQPTPSSQQPQPQQTESSIPSSEAAGNEEKPAEQPSSQAPTGSES